MTHNEQEQLNSLIHPLNDALSFQIEIIEVYAKKIDPDLRFEILNACRGLRSVQRQVSGVVHGLINNAETGELERALQAKKERRLSDLRGKMAAFELLAGTVKQQIRSTEELIRQEEGPVKRSKVSRGKEMKSKKLS